MKKIIFGSGNKGKIKEVQHLFKETDIRIVSLFELGEIPEIEENADTFEGNAKLKAETIFKIYKMPVIADDSGLVVKQLDGRPGIFSARFAGQFASYKDNNEKLLNELRHFPKPHLAKFVCSAVYFDGRDFLISYGEFEGEIVDEFRGENGFGYDPLFLPENSKFTLAEMASKDKNKISHRAKAFTDLRKKIEFKYSI